MAITGCRRFSGKFNFGVGMEGGGGEFSGDGSLEADRLLFRMGMDHPSEMSLGVVIAVKDQS